MPGTNAKMNEMQALMGSLVLGCIDELLARRERIAGIYRQRLSEVEGIRFPPSLPDDVRYNYAYLPVEIDRQECGLDRDELCQELKTYNIYTRRYFYPLICNYACYRNLSLKDPLTVARRVASRILTLPIYPDLAEADVHRICDIIQMIHQEHGKLAERALAGVPGTFPALESRAGAPDADTSGVLATP